MKVIRFPKWYSFSFKDILIDIDIPSFIKDIPFGTFYRCHKLKRIILSNNILKINPYTFYECESLTSISIPSSVKRIDMCAFYGCISLHDVILSEGIEYIKYRAFDKCENLNNINFPNTLKTIESLSFRNCTSLNEIHIPSSLKDYANVCDIFCLSKINKLVIPSMNATYKFRIGYDCDVNILEYEEGCECIHNSIGDNVKTVILPSSVKRLYIETFSKFLALTTIDISNVLYISDNAFMDCKSLVSITLSNDIIYIGSLAFYGCDNLKYVKTTRDKPTHLNGLILARAFGNCFNLLEIDIPQSVSEIRYQAFINCKSLEKIYIPESVSYITIWSFCGCDNIKIVEFDLDSHIDIYRYINKPLVCVIKDEFL